MRRGLKTMWLVGVVGCVLLAGTVGQAALLITESFDYSAGALNGQNGGTGWSGAWSVTDTDGTAVVTSDGLTFGDMPVSGRAAEISISSTSAFVDMKATRGVSNMPNTGDDLWVSFLYKRSDSAIGSNGSRTAEIRHNGTNFRMQVKRSGSQGSALDYGDGTFVTNGTKNIQDGNVYFVVARFGDVGEASGKHALMWILTPDDYDTVIADGTVSATELDAHHYLRLDDAHSQETFGSIWMGIATSQAPFSATFDELKYGTSADDVIPQPVPEPATIGLIAVGTLGLLRRK